MCEVGSWNSSASANTINEIPANPISRNKGRCLSFRFSPPVLDGIIERRFIPRPPLIPPHWIVLSIMCCKTSLYPALWPLREILENSLITAVIGDRPTLVALSWHEVRGRSSGCLSSERYIRTYRKSLLSADKIPDHVFANFARFDTASPTIIVSFA